MYNDYSAEEAVFSNSDLRLYILQYSIGEYPKIKPITCRDKIKEKMNNITNKIIFKMISFCYPGIPPPFFR